MNKVSQKNMLAGGLIVLIGAIAIIGLTIKKPNVTTGKQKDTKLTAFYNSIPTDGGKANFLKQSDNLTKEVDPVLADLDKQIITCSPSVGALLTSAPSTRASCSGGSTTLKSMDGLYLSGQCCGPMTDLDDYNKELQNLQKYKDIPGVPLNPFKTPVALAKTWIDYDNSTPLTADEQVTFDQAMGMSKEKPCCCKCWHYFVNEGVAKKMIKEYHYTGQQVAAYWDTSDICGG